MPKKSGLTNRNVVNHQNGKGDKSRVTNVQAYRDNFDEINWGPKQRTLKELIRLGRQYSKELLSLRELEDEHEWRMGL